MRILIEELTGEPFSADGEIPRSAYGKEMSLLEPVKITAELQKSGREVAVRGSAGTVIELTCCRCLEKFPRAVSAVFDLIYSPAARFRPEQNERLCREDLKTVLYEEPVVDLAEDARQAIHLAVPFKPLCREECRGLCPVCGRNLNEDGCDCARGAVNLKFAELKKLIPGFSAGIREERSRENGES